MCNAKHLLTTALNVLKMIKQEGNFSQQALTDGFSNNELTFGAAWGWEREPGAGSDGCFGAENSERATFVIAGLGGRTAAPPRGPSGMGRARVGCSQWHRAMGWGDVAAPGQPVYGTAPGAPSSRPGPSGPCWGCADAEQSSDEARGEAAPERIEMMLQQIGFNYVNEGS